MPANITPPFTTFPDVDGKPLENGYVYVGVENLDPQTNPQVVYWDEALTMTAAQPLRTSGGFIVNAGTPSRIFCANKYSVKALNKRGSAVYTDLSFGGFDVGLRSDLSQTATNKGSNLVGHIGQYPQESATTVNRFLRRVMHISRWGGEPGADVKPAFTKMLADLSASEGAEILFDEGIYSLSANVNMPNRIALRGANGRGTSILAQVGYTDASMFTAANGVGSMFGSRMTDLIIDANNQASIAQAVWARAWQESCGMDRVVVRNFRQYGLKISDGYGGAAYLPLRDVEFFAQAGAGSPASIRCEQISLVGSFVLSIDGLTASDSAIAVDMANDTLWFKGLHVEACPLAIRMRGAGALVGDVITGSPTATVDLIEFAAGFTGEVSVRGVIPHSATGFSIKDLTPSARNVPVAEGPIARYERVSGFYAYAGAAIIAANGFLTFNTERYDLRSDYNAANGIFTARKSGMHRFTAALRWTPVAATTTVVVQLATSGTNGTIELGRSNSLSTIQSSSVAVTQNYSASVYLQAGQTARMGVSCGGAPASIDLAATESWFSGEWISN